MNTRNVLGIIVAILAILLFWTSYKSCQLTDNLTAAEAKNVKLDSKIGDLESLKVELETSVDSLEVAYNSLSEENASLSTSIEKEQARVRRRNATIKKLKAAKNSSASENSSLQAQISSLLAAKSALESNISSLQAENQALKDKLGIVEGNLSKAKDDNSALDALNRSMQSEIANLTLSTFKATAFQVAAVKKRKDKVTAKSRWAKYVKVSFDLTNVPEKYQGVRPLYMVITDQTSNPIFLDNPIKATVKMNGQSSEIIAAEKKEINIKENQRLNFNHKLGKRLKKGYYRVIVYTDIGVLGASTIRLR